MIAALALISAVATSGKPCPTKREIAEQTGVPRRKVWDFCGWLQERGLIEVELMGDDNPKRRRLRVAGGPWTAWTERRLLIGGNEGRAQR